MSEQTAFRKGQWVLMASSPPDLDGLVVRAAKNGRWVDVRWRSCGETWTKRMTGAALASLRITGTIQRGDWQITELANG